MLIFQKALNLFWFECEIILRVHSWNQPVLSTEDKVSCSRKQIRGIDWDNWPIKGRCTNPCVSALCIKDTSRKQFQIFQHEIIDLFYNPFSKPTEIF